MVDLPLPECPTNASTLPGSMLSLKSLQEQRDHHHYCLTRCESSLERLQHYTSGFSCCKGSQGISQAASTLGLNNDATISQAAEFVAAASARCFPANPQINTCYMQRIVSSWATQGSKQAIT